MSRFVVCSRSRDNKFNVFDTSDFIVECLYPEQLKTVQSMGYDVIFDSECDTFSTLIDLMGIFVFGKNLGNGLSTVVDAFKPFAKYGLDVPNSYRDGIWVGMDTDIGTVLGGVVFDKSVSSLYLLALIFLNDGKIRITGYNICEAYNIVGDYPISHVKVVYYGGDSVWLSVYPEDASGNGLRFSVRYY